MNTLSSLLNYIGNEIGTTRSHLRVGEIRAFAGGTVPSKWKLCDGSVISRTDYADLFTAIGTTWGGGDGSTTFAVPDLKGRTPIGAGESAASGHTAHTLGQMSGEETHLLKGNESGVKYHRHSSNDGTGYATGGVYGLVDSAQWRGVVLVGGGSHNTGYAGDTDASNRHNIMQPYSTVNYIIYTGVA